MMRTTITSGIKSEAEKLGTLKFIKSSILFTIIQMDSKISAVVNYCERTESNIFHL